MGSSSYVYQRLKEPDKQIRLLTLLPARKRESVIRTRLSCHPIPGSQDAKVEKFRKHLRLPVFFGISYVWQEASNSSDGHYILVDGRRCSVSKTVHGALKTLRAACSTSLRYWIDCICINQADSIEKAQQIPLMPDIYALSASVLVWLGEPTRESDRATMFVNKLTSRPATIKAQYLWLDFDEQESSSGMSSTKRLVREIRFAIVWIIYTILMSSVSWLALAGRITADYSAPARDRSSARRYLIKSIDEFKIHGPLTYWGEALHNGWYVQRQKILQETIDEYEKKRAHSAAEFPSINAVDTDHQSSANENTPDCFWGKITTTFKRRKARREHRHYEYAITELEKLPQDEWNSRKQHEKPWEPTAESLQAVSTTDMNEMVKVIGDTVFANSQYFDRMWTLQEACVSGRVSILHGKMWINLDDLLKAFIYLNNITGKEISNAEKAIRLRWIGSEYQGSHRLPLQLLLYESRDRHCGDLRDNIYALLGLMYEQPTILLQPDYQAPIAQVFANATRFIIASSRSLDAICGHEPCHQITDLPSWTPNFSCYGGDDVGPLVDLSGRETLYQASCGQEPQPLPDLSSMPEDWRFLLVSGLCLATITQLSDVSQAGETFAHIRPKWDVPIVQHRAATMGASIAIASTLDILSNYFDFYEGGLQLRQWMDSGDTQALNASFAAAENSRAAQEFYKIYTEVLVSGKLRGEDDFNNLMRDAAPRTEAGDRALEKLCSAVLSGMRCRRMFATDDTNIWGSAPNCAQPGDQVFVLNGCSVPVVLRKLQGDHQQYRFIGPCYSKGLMQGEAFSTWKSSSAAYGFEELCLI